MKVPPARRSISFQMDNLAQTNVPDNLQAMVTDLLLPVIDENQAEGYVIVAPEQTRNYQIVVAQLPVAVDHHPPDNSQAQAATMTTPQTSRVYTIPEENIKGTAFGDYNVEKCISAMKNNPNAKLPVLEHQISKYLSRGTEHEALVKRDDGNCVTLMLNGNQNAVPELTFISANLV